MPLSTAALESLAVEFSTLGTYIGLHTGDPGATGANAEASGGSPAYVRKPTSWSAGASDGIVTGSQVTIDVGAGNYSWMSVWSAATGGSFIGRAPITATNLGAQGQILVTPTLTIT